MRYCQPLLKFFFAAKNCGANQYSRSAKSELKAMASSPGSAIFTAA
jgi:hypothetical protein